MDYYLAVSKIHSDCEFNPSCFNFTEAEARAKGLWRDPRPMPTQAELDTVIALHDKEVQVNAAYDLMVKDIYDQMETVFGTRNDVSAAASASTYEAMIKRPENYVDASIGLSDATAVTAYATTKIAEGDAYALFRLKRIAQFTAEKTSILGS